MAVRTTSAAVIQIMDNCTVSTTIIDTLIIAASAVIDKVFEYDTVMTDVMLTEVEKWLTAHMIATTLSKTTTEEKVGDASVKYTGKYGEGLKSTPYGQMVLLLDVTGLMGNSGKQAASIYAVPGFDN
jgi:hypothetical protein